MQMLLNIIYNINIITVIFLIKIKENIQEILGMIMQKMIIVALHI